MLSLSRIVTLLSRMCLLQSDHTDFLGYPLQIRCQQFSIFFTSRGVKQFPVQQFQSFFLPPVGYHRNLTSQQHGLKDTIQRVTDGNLLLDGNLLILRVIGHSGDDIIIILQEATRFDRVEAMTTPYVQPTFHLNK